MLSVRFNGELSVSYRLTALLALLNLAPLDGVSGAAIDVLLLTSVKDFLSPIH